MLQKLIKSLQNSRVYRFRLLFFFLHIVHKWIHIVTVLYSVVSAFTFAFTDTNYFTENLMLSPFILFSTSFSQETLGFHA